MICFPDVNVWIALTVAEHVHHNAAIEWSETAEWDVLTFCRITQLGFLRLLTNSRVMGHRVMTCGQAWQTFDKLRENSAITLTAEPPGLEDTWRRLKSVGGSAPNAWTDAYLAAFAEATGYTLITFDRGFARHKNAPCRILRGPERPN